MPPLPPLYCFRLLCSLRSRLRRTGVPPCGGTLQFTIVAVRHAFGAPRIVSAQAFPPFGGSAFANLTARPTPDGAGLASLWRNFHKKGNGKLFVVFLAPPTRAGKIFFTPLKEFSKVVLDRGVSHPPKRKRWRRPHPRSQAALGGGSPMVIFSIKPLYSLFLAFALLTSNA